MVLNLTGTASRVIHPPLPIDDPRRRRPDIGKVSRLLNWSPATPLDEGLRATIEWFRVRQGSPAPADIDLANGHAPFDRLSSSGPLATS
ncbi:MAG: hypothetical protein U1E59_20990 [Amaricoccus sp.]